MINTLDQIMHHRNIGVVYLDCEAKVLSANEIATAFLKQDSEVHCAGNDFFNSKFSQITHGAEFVSLFVKRSIDKPPLKLSLHPVSDSLAFDSEKCPVSLLLVTDTKDKSELDIDSLANYYDLTAAEACLVFSLHNGMTLKEHSEDRGIKITTTRWTLDNVFSKTYVNSQADLRDLASKFII